MTVYLDLVILLNFGVDLLLLCGASRLCGYPAGWRRCALSALFGGIYAGVCMLPGFSFMGNLFWRLISLACMAVLAFGWNKSALRRGVLFVLLCMALGGIAVGFSTKGFLQIIAAAAAVCVMCLVGFRGRIGGRQCVQVVLRMGQRKKQLLALKDTGNALHDPITGQGVLVVGSDVAQELFGLTEQALKDPIHTLQNSSLRGLRLIPYSAVGQPRGMLLAMCMDEVQVDGQRSGKVVAFAPQIIGAGEAYQALTGVG